MQDTQVADTKAPVTIIKTNFFPRRLRSGRKSRPECWGAHTSDLQWSMERSDDTGTSWSVYHCASVADGTCIYPVLMCGSLEQCTELIFNGRADVRLAALKAELAATR